MPSRKTFIVPDVCKNTTVLSIVVVTQLCAIIATLLSDRGDFVTGLGSASLYLHWLSLTTTLVLCRSRVTLNALSDRSAIIAVFVICLCLFCVVELGSQWVLLGLGDFILGTRRFFANLVIAIIFTYALVRLFSVTSVLEQRNKAEVESRIQALQSRIRPHFLFNSLNTIAELTATEPGRAEEAIDSLSQLFRASLETERRFHSLDSELNLCRRYLSLETWRLEERLKVSWNLKVKNTKRITVPKLILQPLLENAIVHGVQDDGSVQLNIDVRETRHDLSVIVENAKRTTRNKTGGHGIAVENIRERLFVLYDDRQIFRIRDSADRYSVLMRFPKYREDSILETNSTILYE